LFHRIPFLAQFGLHRFERRFGKRAYALRWLMALLNAMKVATGTVGEKSPAKVSMAWVIKPNVLIAPSSIAP
jgi:hypothetical protein